MTSTKAALSINEVISTFEQGIVEVEGADLKQFVVAIVSDGTPMRITGNDVRMFGKAIYTSAFSRDAQMIPDGINKQFAKLGGDTRVAVEKSSDWKLHRVAKLREFITDIQSRNS